MPQHDTPELDTATVADIEEALQRAKRVEHGAVWVLRVAAIAIEERGWRRGEFGYATGPLDLHGAMQTAAFGRTGGPSEAMRESEVADAYAYAVRVLLVSIGTEFSLMYWNDAKCGSKERAVQVLQDAAAEQQRRLESAGVA